MLTGISLTACATSLIHSTRDGLVEYAGAQKEIFATGKASQVLTAGAILQAAGTFAVGAVSGLDGELTVAGGRTYVTKVREAGYAMDHAPDTGAVFAVWTQQASWQEEDLPESVRGYVDLQNHVKSRALAYGIDASKPFPFRLTGMPAEVKWHINVDLTAGQPITPELFAKSKANYLLKNQALEIIGFFSENHPGVFISSYAPAIRPGDNLKNAIHIHFVTTDGQAAGHIDDLILAPGMKLLLPKI